MMFAYADPPYLGQGRHYAKHHPDAYVWDDPETHRQLISRLVDEYPDGWALSASSSSLWTLLPMCPSDVRIAAWCKSFGAFKKGVRPAYMWEPVIYRGGRNGFGEAEVAATAGMTPKDFIVCAITLRKGLVGAKPIEVCAWILDLLGYQRGDELDDLFPGTGAMTTAQRHVEGRLPLEAAS